MLINVCVFITYYLFILVTLKAESLLINWIQLIKIWWQTGVCIQVLVVGKFVNNMTLCYKYSVHLSLILIAFSNHIFFHEPNGEDQSCQQGPTDQPPTLQDRPHRRSQAHPPDVPLISRMPGGPALIIPVVWTTWGQETCLHLIHGAWRCNLRAETCTYSDEYRVQDHGGVSMQRTGWMLSARAIFRIFLVSNKPCKCMELILRDEITGSANHYTHNRDIKCE